MTAEPMIDSPGDQTAAAAPVTVRASLSPSRAADFKTCPLLYRFRSIDRLPERPTVEQARGTLVHAVLERLFDLPAAARSRVGRRPGRPQWDRLLTEEPELATLFADGDAVRAAGVPPVGDGAAGRLLRGGGSAPAGAGRARALISAVVDDELLIRGYLDRLDVAPDGALRVVDYKTGGAPREAFEARALFQLKFYALVLWRTRGVVPRVLRLLYLKDAEVCDYAPDADELVRFERTVVALWRAIEQATARQDFRPRPSRLCDWCNHQALCPSYGGTPPPFPMAAAAPDPLVDARSRPRPRRRRVTSVPPEDARADAGPGGTGSAGAPVQGQHAKPPAIPLETTPPDRPLPAAWAHGGHFAEVAVSTGGGRATSGRWRGRRGWMQPPRRNGVDRACEACTTGRDGFAEPARRAPRAGRVPWQVTAGRIGCRSPSDECGAGSPWCPAITVLAGRAEPGQPADRAA
ncbi:PD-(D/E)XK nuclease family protein [Micromonospora sp. BRA006-A]|nr:PD-(D/E)XK nuclease family protein [Micromonospora sp. BRA006-A]